MDSNIARGLNVALQPLIKLATVDEELLLAGEPVIGGGEGACTPPRWKRPASPAASAPPRGRSASA